MTEQTLLIAQVAVEKTAYHFDRLFSYIIPQTLVRKVAVGSRVLVPFAKGNRARQGFVLRLAAAAGETQLKEISCVLDEQPILTAELAQLAFLSGSIAFARITTQLKPCCRQAYNIKLRRCTALMRMRSQKSV